jgi:hypothetical protein
VSAPTTREAIGPATVRQILPFRTPDVCRYLCLRFLKVSSATGCSRELCDIIKSGRDKGDANQSLAYYGQVTVRWESAKPILQITGTPIPKEFRNHYFHLCA